MGVLARKQFNDVSLSAITTETGRPFVRVTVTGSGGVVAVTVDRAMRSASGAEKFIHESDEATANRGKQMLMGICGDFVEGLNRALSAPIGAIDAQVMLFDRANKK